MGLFAIWNYPNGNQSMLLLDVLQATTEKRDLVFELSKSHVDQQFKDEMTNILMSKGSIKPSFSFMEKINVHITKLR